MQRAGRRLGGRLPAWKPGLGWRGVRLVLAELGEGAVDLAEEQEAAEGTILAQAAVAPDFRGCGHPGGSLGFLQSPPGGRNSAKVGTDGHLPRGARVGGNGQRATDLAERAILRDVQTAFT